MTGSKTVVVAARDSTAAAHHGGNPGPADLWGAQSSAMRRNLHGDQIG